MKFYIFEEKVAWNCTYSISCILLLLVCFSKYTRDQLWSKSWLIVETLICKLTIYWIFLFIIQIVWLVRIQTDMSERFPVWEYRYCTLILSPYEWGIIYISWELSRWQSTEQLFLESQKSYRNLPCRKPNIGHNSTYQANRYQVDHSLRAE